MKRVLLLLAGCVLAVGVLVLRPKAAPEAGRFVPSSRLRLTFANADAVVDAMREALVRRDLAILIRFRERDGYMDDVPPLVDELMAWAMEDTDDPKEGDYLRYQSGGYEVSWSHDQGRKDWSYTLAIKPKYYTTPEEEAKVDEDVRMIIDGMAFDRDDPAYGKIRALYRYVCSHVRYDRIHHSSLYHQKSTAYAALERGYAGCQGYSVLLYRLLKECGIPCRVVTGMCSFGEGQEFHAWNIAQVDGRFYHLDATWDAYGNTEECFLRGDGNFEGHVLDARFRTESFAGRYPLAETDYEPESEDV